VIPVVGFFIGFPLGVYLQGRQRLGRHVTAWHSTQEALRAMGLSILIELTVTVLAAGAWLAVVLACPGAAEAVASRKTTFSELLPPWVGAVASGIEMCSGCSSRE
jgi:hypothetical protein